MKKDWLWDRKISVREAKSILKNPKHIRFLELAALLLKRKNTPTEIFKDYISPVDFCQNWSKIKKIMNKDIWGQPRMYFWQAIYEKTKEKLGKKGQTIKNASPVETDDFCKIVGRKIKNFRKEKGITQRKLAGKLKVSQQIISRIESGRQNSSILTLRDIVSALGGKLDLEL